MNLTSAPNTRRAGCTGHRDLESGQWLSDSHFVWRKQRVVAEFDGDDHRTDRQQWQNDVARRENVQDDGWAFMPLTWASVWSIRETGQRSADCVDYSGSRDVVKSHRLLPGATFWNDLCYFTVSSSR